MSIDVSSFDSAVKAHTLDAAKQELMKATGDKGGVGADFDGNAEAQNVWNAGLEVIHAMQANPDADADVSGVDSAAASTTPKPQANSDDSTTSNAKDGNAPDAHPSGGGGDAPSGIVRGDNPPGGPDETPQGSPSLGDIDWKKTEPLQADQRDALQQMLAKYGDRPDFPKDEVNKVLSSGQMPVGGKILTGLYMYARDNGGTPALIKKLAELTGQPVTPADPTTPATPTGGGTNGAKPTYDQVQTLRSISSPGWSDKQLSDWGNPLGNGQWPPADLAKTIDKSKLTDAQRAALEAIPGAPQGGGAPSAPSSPAPSGSHDSSGVKSAWSKVQGADADKATKDIISTLDGKNGGHPSADDIAKAVDDQNWWAFDTGKTDKHQVHDDMVNALKSYYGVK